jgi:hypothetical protein
MNYFRKMTTTAISVPLFFTTMMLRVLCRKISRFKHPLFVPAAEGYSKSKKIKLLYRIGVVTHEKSQPCKSQPGCNLQKKISCGMDGYR